MIDLKVSGTSTERPRTNTTPKPTSTPTEGPAPAFTASLKAARRTLLEGNLSELLGKIRALGKKFLQSPSNDSLEEYRDGVGQFLERVSKELFSLKQELGLEKDGQQKAYQLVETVNRELETLTRETLRDEQALRLLGSLDEIRGLVLDLLS
ncbi:MAG TPA: YaaR family protein [Candidatus Ozemobacteraceae bacterium]|nr:YaaR family protein [Candidatus Ozemobacteraceae bacterium]